MTATSTLRRAQVEPPARRPAYAVLLRVTRGLRHVRARLWPIIKVTLLAVGVIAIVLGYKLFGRDAPVPGDDERIEIPDASPLERR